MISSFHRRGIRKLCTGKTIGHLKCQKSSSSFWMMVYLNLILWQEMQPLIPGSWAKISWETKRTTIVVQSGIYQVLSNGLIPIKQLLNLHVRMKVCRYHNARVICLVNIYFLLEATSSQTYMWNVWTRTLLQMCLCKEIYDKTLP